MKVSAFVFMLCLSLSWAANSAEQALEYQVAVIDAGKYIAPTDSSVGRAKALLSATAKVYRVTPSQAADVAAKGKELSHKSGLDVAVTEILDGALIVCDTVCSLDQLRNFVAYYVTTRQATGQTHHQAVHGFLILNYVANTTMGKDKRK